MAQFENGIHSNHGAFGPMNQMPTHDADPHYSSSYQQQGYVPSYQEWQNPQQGYMEGGDPTWNSSGDWKQGLSTNYWDTPAQFNPGYGETQCGSYSQFPLPQMSPWGSFIDLRIYAHANINYGVCCKQLFPSKTGFEVHRIQAHKNGGYKCQIHYCRKVFPQKSSLTLHEEEKHAGEVKGPIHCNVCFTILPHPEENEGLVKYHTFLHTSSSS